MSVPKTIFTPAFSAFLNETPCSAARLRSRLPVRRVRRRPVVIVSGERRAVPCALLHHLRDLRVGDFQAVLDRVATAVQGALQADAVVSVASDFLSPAVGFVHDRLQFFHGQGWLRNQFAVLSHPGTMRHVDLDPVGAVVELFARRFARFDRTVDDLRALGHVEFRRVAFEVVAAGG